MKTIAKLFVVVLFVALTLCGCVEKPSGNLVFRMDKGDDIYFVGYDLNTGETTQYAEDKVLRNEISPNANEMVVFKDVDIMGVPDHPRKQSTNILFYKDLQEIASVTFNIPEEFGNYVSANVYWVKSGEFIIVNGEDADRKHGYTYVYRVRNDKSLKFIQRLSHGVDHEALALSPDGQKILYSVRGDWDPANNYWHYDLRIVSIKTGEEKTIFNYASYVIYTQSVKWTKDGIVFAYHMPDDDYCISIFYTRGDNLSTKCYPAESDHWDLSMTVSPDGSKLSLAANPYFSDRTHIIIVDIGSFEITDVSDYLESAGYNLDYFSSDTFWSPDGKYLGILRGDVQSERVYLVAIPINRIDEKLFFDLELNIDQSIVHFGWGYFWKD